MHLATHGRQSSHESLNCKFMALIQDTHARLLKRPCQRLSTCIFVGSNVDANWCVEKNELNHDFLTLSTDFVPQMSSKIRQAYKCDKYISVLLLHQMLCLTTKKHFVANLCFPAKYRRLPSAASLFKSLSESLNPLRHLPYEELNCDKGRWSSRSLVVVAVDNEFPWKAS